jgi:hypothetical protein
VRSSISNGLATLASVALVVVAFAVHRLQQRGELELAASDRAFDAGQLQLAVQHARRAASADLPGAEHVRLGYDRLRAVARGAERAHDLELARWSWQAVRTAALESRHLWQPHAAELREADAELARLSPEARALGQRRDTHGPALALALAGGAGCAGAGLWGLCSQESADAWDKGRRRLRLAAFSTLLGVATWIWALLSI